MPTFPSIEQILLLNAVTGLSLGRELLEPEQAAPVQGGLPQTFLFDGQELAALRQHYEQGEEPIVSAVRTLCEKADSALLQPSLSVTQKSEAPSGGSIHDYYSLAKYWWPNQETPDGLPYVCHDGEVNPDCYSERFDAVRLTTFVDLTNTLTLAGYLSGSAEYAAKAVDFVDAWMLDEKTAQTPHFAFAQVALGHDGVRAPSIIESRHLISLVDSVRILLHMGVLTQEKFERVQDWFRALLEWFRTSPAGKAADRAQNNVGFWYDAQCLAYAEFVGSTDVAEHIITRSVPARLDAQIEPDGAITSEMSRAKPHDYIAFSLVAMAVIARMAEGRGVDLWSYETSDGRNFQVASEWLASLPKSKEAKWKALETLNELNLRDETDAQRSLSRAFDLQAELNLLRKLSEGRRQVIVSRDSVLKHIRAELADRESKIRRRDRQIGHLDAKTAALSEELDRRAVEAGKLAAELETSRAEASKLARELKRTRARAATLYRRAEESEYYLRKMKNSTSWRLTAPVRKISRFWRRAGRRIRGKPVHNPPAVPMETAPTPLAPVDEEAICESNERADRS